MHELPRQEDVGAARSRKSVPFIAGDVSEPLLDAKHVEDDEDAQLCAARAFNHVPHLPHDVVDQPLGLQYAERQRQHQEPAALRAVAWRDTL